LIDEARKTGKLGHPGVPPVFDIGKEDEGKPFLTMQLISGEKLSERYKTLKHESISQSDFVNQIRPVLRHLIAACNTVDFAFDNEAVIHRDLKPDNIMVNRHGETVVMEWGWERSSPVPRSSRMKPPRFSLSPCLQGVAPKRGPRKEPSKVR
jgi:serine/threonine-protein kinase